MMQPLILSEDFKACLDELEHSDQHFFLTGRAGTGKSTLLQLFRKTTGKKVIVLAPTGVAALHVQGQTIHSFFQFPPRLLTGADIKKVKNPKFFASIDTIVIDEISMVRADVLDNIDLALRLNRQDSRPFGGIQMIFIGDLFQLPPVVAGEQERHYFSTVYESAYFFSAKVFRRGFRPTFMELLEVFRQEERRFIALLESVRMGDVDADILEDLNSRVGQPLDPSHPYITLTSRNAVARKINRDQLDHLQAPTIKFPAKITGNFAQKLYPTDEILMLKEGAQVMFLRNDSMKRYVNGTIGTVTRLEEDNIRVVVKGTKQERTISVEPVEWEIIRYDRKSAGLELKTEVIGSFAQYPLKLAWAITIHKSQGKTFDHVVIDLAGGAFEHGQTYVALSRCRSLQGIVLNHPIRFRDIMVDEKIIDFQRNLLR